MSKLRNDSDHLTLELMKKFREGTLSAEEAARLKELQTHDPFIADALEGITVLADAHAFAEDVDELRGWLKQRTSTKKSLTIYWLPVAASLLLLAGTFYVVYTYILSSDSSPLSVKETVPSATDSEENINAPSRLSPISQLPPQALTDTDTPIAQINELPPSLALVEVPAIELEAVVSPDAAPESEAGAAQSAQVPQPLSEVTSEAFDENFSLAGKKSAEKEEQKQVVASFRARSKAVAAPVAADSAEGRYTISGKVIDQESGEPIAGANVLVKGTKTGAVADVEGNFSISLPEKHKSLPEKHKQLLISSIGYGTSEATISQDDTLLIALEQDLQSLSEVVVVGYGNSDNGGQEVYATSAQPQTGMRAFKKYLSEQQRHPDDWKESDKAVVKLSFTVFPNGKLSSITVEKSADEWLDQEAIRLVQEGPAWKAATQNGQAVGQEVKLRIRFKK